MLTDPIADLLTRIKNASKPRLENVLIPSSRIKVAICEILKEEGYISSYKVVNHVEANKKESSVKKDIVVTLKYDVDGTPVISDLKRISKPGLRVYTDVENMPRVLNGLGIAIISTSKGVMTDKKARKLNVGGEVLAFVW